MRDAEGQVKVKKDEITEKAFYSGRKAVAAKDVVTGALAVGIDADATLRSGRLAGRLAGHAARAGVPALLVADGGRLWQEAAHARPFEC